jgi:predicted nucleotidyltransferase
MMQTSGLQCYTKVGAKNMVINGLNAAKLKQEVPVILEIPTSGLCSFSIENLEVDNGLVWLEDKQENIKQALDSGVVYEFYANAGLNADRFILHFELIHLETDNTHDLVSAADFCEKGPSVYAEAAGVVVIDLSATTQSVTAIEIKDASGKVVYTGALTDQQSKIQLQQANGIYYVSLNTEKGIEVHKLFVQQ